MVISLVGMKRNLENRKILVTATRRLADTLRNCEEGEGGGTPSENLKKILNSITTNGPKRLFYYHFATLRNKE